MAAWEINFDGIVGLTHNYAGLSYGNVASMQSKKNVSHPKAAALQGLAKMTFLADLGIKQAVLPPHERPHIPTLRKLGFTGKDSAILEKVYKQDRTLLAAVSSASAMWAANSATVSPSADTFDHRVHFTPANLITQFHRSIEPPTTAKILRTIFADEKYFAHHDPLPASPQFADEGAANHMRRCNAYGKAGEEIFVYGRRASEQTKTKFPARQTYEACLAIARSHLLKGTRVTFLRQNPKAIDAGAFHNDVVAVANQNVLLRHNLAFAEKIRSFNPATFPLKDAVGSYVFNSQLVTLPSGSMSLIAPMECKKYPSVLRYIDSLLANDIVHSIHYVDVRQSMKNGGGPACLRLRVVLTDVELSRLHGNVLLTDTLHLHLRQWIEKHYRDTLHPDDLRDPKLLDESRVALDELTRLLKLGHIYEFQHTSI